MNMLLQLQTLLKLAVVLLLGLLPLHQTSAQETQKTERKMRVKMITEQNGRTVLIDTTITVTADTDIARALHAAKIDTARFRMLNKKMTAYTFDQGEMGKARLQLLRADTTMQRKLKDMQVMTFQVDSMSQNVMKRFRILHGDSLLNGKGSRVFMRTLTDSAMIHISDANRNFTFNPREIERIIVHTIPSPARIDSLLKLQGKVQYKVLIEDGKKKVYRIHDDGREEEVEHTDFSFGEGKMGRAIFIVHKAKVETPTTAEKEQLKATGAPVEMKSREELKVEDISYYPNPNNGRFNLKFSLKNKGTTVVRVMDAQGREVFVDTVEKLTGAYEREIDLTPFGRGMFFLQVAQGGRYHTKKIVVQ